MLSTIKEDDLELRVRSPELSKTGKTALNESGREFFEPLIGRRLSLLDVQGDSLPAAREFRLQAAKEGEHLRWVDLHDGRIVPEVFQDGDRCAFAGTRRTKKYYNSQTLSTSVIEHGQPPSGFYDERSPAVDSYGRHP
jgi:hypothetical protein